MKVKLLVAMAGARSAAAGEEWDCDASEAARLIEAGYAEAITPVIERATKPAPKARRAS